MTIEKDNLKVFSVRLPRELWKFIKMDAANQELAMTDIVEFCLNEYKKNRENSLTHIGDSV